MRDYVMFEDSLVITPTRLTRSRPDVVLLVAAVSWLLSVALCTAAILAPAPSAVVPLVALIAIGVPLFAGWEAPIAVAYLRSRRSAGRAMTAFRRTLAQLPETEHPHGFE